MFDSQVKARKKRISGKFGGWGYIVNILVTHSTTGVSHLASFKSNLKKLPPMQKFLSFHKWFQTGV